VPGDAPPTSVQWRQQEAAAARPVEGEDAGLGDHPYA
jgi:hypothetical protein